MARRRMLPILATVLALTLVGLTGRAAQAQEDIWPWADVCAVGEISKWDVVNDPDLRVLLQGWTQICPGNVPNVEARWGLAYYPPFDPQAASWEAYVLGTRELTTDPYVFTIGIDRWAVPDWSAVAAICIVSGVDDDDRMSCVAVDSAKGLTITSIPTSDPRVKAQITKVSRITIHPLCGSCA